MTTNLTKPSNPHLNSNANADTNAQPKLAGTLLKITIGMIGMFAFMQVYSLQSILPVLMQDFGIGEVVAGGLVGATVLGIALLSPFVGMASDAFGRKWLIILALLLLAVPTALMAVASSTDMMLWLRFMQGMAVPGITVVTIAYVGEEYQGGQLTKLMAYYVSGTVLGGFLGRFVLGHLQEWVGWRTGFLCMGVVTLFGALWTWWALPASRQFVANRQFGSALQMLMSHAKNRYVISACLLGACVLFTLVSCFTFINLHLAASPYYLSSGSLSNIFSVYLLGVVITPLTTQLLGRFGSARTVLVAVSISALGVLMSLTSPLWVIVLALAIMSSGVFITQSATISYIAVNVKQGRSLASGLYYLCYYLGGSIGAWAGGLAYQWGQWQAVVVVILAIQLLALLIAAKLMIKKPMVKQE